MRKRLLVSLAHVVALEADYWLTGRSDEIEGKEKRRLTPLDSTCGRVTQSSLDDFSFDIDVAASFFRSGNTSTTLSRRPFGSSSSTGARSSAVPSHPEPLREDSIRNRENLVVSNREIRQLFDTIKELGDIVKRQNAKLDSLSVELENACKEVAEVKTELQTV